MQNKKEHFKWLIDQLWKIHKGLTFDEIMIRWQLETGESEFSLKTHQRNILAIRKEFGIDIKINRENWRYYIRNRDEIENNPVRKITLNNILFNHSLSNAERIKGRIQFENISDGEKWLSTIIKALKSNRKINIIYQRTGAYGPEEYNNLEPYILKNFRQRWYMLARKDKTQELRLFGLDRIHDIQILDTKFTYRESDSEDFFANSFGVVINEKLESKIIKIKVNKNTAHYFETLAFHKSQTIEPGDDFTIFTYHLKITDDLIYELLKWSQNIEVLEPQELRDRMRTIAEQLLEKYKK